MKTKRTIQLLLGVISLLPLVFIAAGIANELKLNKIRRECIVVEGLILDGGELTRARGIKTHYLKVQFHKNNQETEVKEFPVDHDDFVHANQSGKIPITYVPGSPRLSRVGTHYGYDRKPLYAAIAAFLLVVFIATSLERFVSKKRNQSAEEKAE